MEKEKQKIEISNEQTPISYNVLKFITRSKSGLQMYSMYTGSPATITPATLQYTGEHAIIVFSKDGSKLFDAVPLLVNIYDTKEKKLINTVNRSAVTALSVSPKGNYLLTWASLTTQGSTDPNLLLYDITTNPPIVVYSVLQKICIKGLPFIQFSEDDQFIARVVTDTILFFECKLGTPARQLNSIRIEGVVKFSWAPGIANKFAVAVTGKKGAPSSAKILSYPGFEDICSKSFAKFDDIELHWNSTGTALLVLAQTDEDNTGKSYYGKSHLFFMAGDGSFDCNLALGADGPLHDLAWSPDGKNFAVIHGFMPSKSTLYDLKCRPLIDFGTAHRNTAKFSPSGRLILIAGFGNLQGEMDIWDQKKNEKNWRNKI